MTFPLIEAASIRHARDEEESRKRARRAAALGFDPTPELDLVEAHHRALVACERELSAVRVRRIS